ncbi:tetratricopeptide repeat protein [Hyphomicrobium sp.]|uniref:tetratricopeptide repeat protein n=1 Tax=Hyphomicrobium sp. TaxID=82 RepID=UPI002E31A0F5|nr:tetratricopeptide repeat protein [Hyphomicrobium sp.]HEX2840807.1 tetratricopeptide repeat protein [Hyphomicrobium sp.]
MITLSTATSMVVLAASLGGAIQDCNEAPDPKRQISGCSAYIASGQAEGENLVTAYVNRAVARAATHAYKGALADFSAALKVDPKNWLVFYNRGSVFFDLGKDDLAIKDFASAIEADPNTAIAYYNRGLAYERRGDMQKALEDYRRAVALDQSDVNAKEHLDRLTAREQNF